MSDDVVYTIMPVDSYAEISSFYRPNVDETVTHITVIESGVPIRIFGRLRIEIEERNYILYVQENGEPIILKI